MTTLGDIRDRIRKDLHDTDTSAERWSDAQLERHIEHALEELSLAIPREVTATVATPAGSRDLDVSALSGLIEVEFVEFPAAQYPPCRVPFRRWAEVVTMGLETPPTESADATVGYTARHTLDDDGSTLPVVLEDLVVTGAAAYAVLEQAAFAIDTLNTGGEAAADRYAAWARARLIAFRQLLMQYGRNNRVRARRLAGSR
jgi:hypothetical protein